MGRGTRRERERERGWGGSGVHYLVDCWSLQEVITNKLSDFIHGHMRYSSSLHDS